MEQKVSTEQKSRFSGQIGFVLAAAGSAVGLGNIWRFPYFVAKDGGGIFILVYLILAMTFGFVFLITDIAIGRKTRKSPIHAYASIGSKWKILGVLTFLVPALIMTYYPVIGGWVTRYILVYFTGLGQQAAESSFFTSFITSQSMPIFYGLLFMGLTGAVIYFGVRDGIERSSRLIMPVLFIIMIAIAIYVLTLEHTDASGQTRTGLQGLKFYLAPSFEGLTVSRFLQILLDAMSQLFFSLSVAMGIMISYGSYVKKEVNLRKAVQQIVFFDTLAALLAGAMIIPTIYVFVGAEGMSAGPSMLFISLPKVFASMGFVGNALGVGFFVIAGFAALTSCISVLEPIVGDCMELFHSSRKKTTVGVTLLYMVAVLIIALGYSTFYVEVQLPNGSTGQILDIVDYISNCFLMPVIALLSCVLVGWFVGPKWIISEVERSGHSYPYETLYTVIIKYIAPIVLIILFLQSTGFLSMIIG